MSSINGRLQFAAGCREVLFGKAIAVHRNQQGSTLIAVVLESMLMLLALGGALSIVHSSWERTSKRLEAASSFYAANAGIEEDIARLLADPTWRGTISDTVNGYSVQVSTYDVGDEVVGLYSIAAGQDSSRFTIRVTVNTTTDQVLTWIERTL